MAHFTSDARRWLRQQRLGPGEDALLRPYDIGVALGQEDRRAGRPDLGFLEEFGFDEAERGEALRGWQVGYRAGHGCQDEAERSSDF